MDDKRLNTTIKHWGSGQYLSELNPIAQNFILSHCSTPHACKYIDATIQIGEYEGKKLSSLGLADLRDLIEDENQTTLMNRTARIYVEERLRKNDRENRGDQIIADFYNRKQWEADAPKRHKAQMKTARQRMEEEKKKADADKEN